MLTKLGCLGVQVDRIVAHIGQVYKCKVMFSKRGGKKDPTYRVPHR